MRIVGRTHKADQALVNQKIQSYLAALSPGAVKMLARSLEGANEKRRRDPQLQLVLDACLESLRAGGKREDHFPAEQILEPENTQTRENQLRRQFFRPLEPLLMDEVLPRKQAGRISRSHLETIWSWISRDVMFEPGSHERLTSVRRSAMARSAPRLEVGRRAAQLREQVLPKLQDALAQAEQDVKYRRKLVMLVGGEAAFLDLADMVQVFKAGDWYEAFLKGLPARLVDKDLTLESPVTRKVRNLSEGDKARSSLIASVLLTRMKDPASLTALAGRLAGGRDGRMLKNSPYAGFIDVALSEADRLFIVAQKRNDEGLTEALGAYHALVRGFERDVDLSAHMDWAQQAHETRSRFSRLVGAQLDGAMGQVRRALSVPAVGREGELQADDQSFAEALRMVRILALLRGAADAFALNEMAGRMRQGVEQTLEIMTRSLLAKAGNLEGREREAHGVAIDRAIRLSEGFFGAEYAALLKRRRNALFASACEQGVQAFAG